MKQLSNYINGEMLAPRSNQYLDSINPATGKPWAQIPDSNEQDVEAAVSAAKAAFPMWSSLSAEKRAYWMNLLADKVAENLEAFALAESMDQGKPLWLARDGEIPRAISNLRFFASGIQHFASESHYMDGHAINYTVRNPIGVAACISPWNLPLYLFTWKIAPALAAGNTVVAKPSEITPVTAFMLAEACIEIGFPKGVLNIIHGYGHKVGNAMISHPDVPVISFTGGTKTGAHIASVAAPMFKKLSLELGGKNPNIIFADCDFEQALKTTLLSSFQNQGEICLCGSRIFIERPLYEKFKTALVEATKQLKVGDPLNPDNRIGAIASKEHLEKILSYIRLAQEEGGTLLCGGQPLHPEGACKEGYFLAPAIIEGLDYTCRTNQEEIFGPVVTLTPFDTEEEVLKMANSTTYGLAGTIWTSNLDKAHRVAHKLKSGIIWINCWLLRDLRTPFGGLKQSGVGREGGWEALRFFTEPRNICIKLRS